MCFVYRFVKLLFSGVGKHDRQVFGCGSEKKPPESLFLNSKFGQTVGILLVNLDVCKSVGYRGYRLPNGCFELWSFSVASCG